MLRPSSLRLLVRAQRVQSPAFQHSLWSVASSNINLVPPTRALLWRPIAQKIALQTRLFSDDSTKKPEGDKEEENEKEEKGATEAGAEETTGEGEGTETFEEEDLEKVKERYEAEMKESKDHLLRALAEVENTRQRSLRDVENARKYSIQSFAKQLLDVADNLNRAMESIPEEKIKEENADESLIALYQGVGMTQKELQKIFNANSISEFGEVGEKFDPNFHEAMFQAPDETKEPNTIS
mmetsp:Transcript_20937/g.25402  ORF Transcript_20937/g.25402 Transcript_20937/m.25402 type:complete len:239 (+) Transcript_20937:175-891(+)